MLTLEPRQRYELCQEQRTQLYREVHADQLAKRTTVSEPFFYFRRRLGHALVMAGIWLQQEQVRMPRTRSIQIDSHR